MRRYPSSQGFARMATAALPAAFFLFVGRFIGGAVIHPPHPPLRGGDGAEEPGTSAPKDRPPPRAKEGEVQVDREARRVVVPAFVLEQGKHYEHLKGAVEFILVAKGGKSYESLFETSAPPEEIAGAFKELGTPPGCAGRGGEPARGARFRILVEHEAGGKKEARPVEAFILHAKEGKALREEAWIFTGSVEHKDPAREAVGLKCETTRSIVGLHFEDDSPLLQNGRKEAWTQNIYKAALDALPPKGTPVRVVFESLREGRDGKAAEGAHAVHAVIAGRIQGLGFPSFAQREARKLEVVGFVRSLEDGRIEVVVEGPKEKVASFLEKLAQGPRGARVEKLAPRDVTPPGSYTDFVIER